MHQKDMAAAASSIFLSCRKRVSNCWDRQSGPASRVGVCSSKFAVP